MHGACEQSERPGGGWSPPPEYPHASTEGIERHQESGERSGGAIRSQVRKNCVVGGAVVRNICRVGRLGGRYVHSLQWLMGG
jgi:hypothetical protein